MYSLDYNLDFLSHDNPWCSLFSNASVSRRTKKHLHRARRHRLRLRPRPRLTSRPRQRTIVARLGLLASAVEPPTETAHSLHRATNTSALSQRPRPRFHSLPACHPLSQAPRGRLLPSRRIPRMPRTIAAAARPTNLSRLSLTLIPCWAATMPLLLGVCPRRLQPVRLNPPKAQRQVRSSEKRLHLSVRFDDGTLCSFTSQVLLRNRQLLPPPITSQTTGSW